MKSTNKILVEKTSKFLKAQKVLSVLIFFVGIGMLLTKTSGAGLIILGAGVWYFGVKFAVWWQHG